MVEALLRARQGGSTQVFAACPGLREGHVRGKAVAKGKTASNERAFRR